MFSDFQYRTDKIQDFFLIAMIPCGLVARIRRFHRRGRGSIPRKGVLFTSHTLTLLRSEERK